MNRSYRAPIYGGGRDVPGAPGNVMATNYTQPPLSPGTQRDVDFYNTLQQQLPGASFDPNQLNVQPKIQPGDPGYNPFLLEQNRDRFILNDPRSGVAEMPRSEIPQRDPNYSIYNDPRLPGARNLRRKLEGILGLPKYNFPQAQQLPMGFQNKTVS